MRALFLVGILTAVGCSDGRGEKPVTPPVADPLEAPDQVLPVGTVGIEYEATVTVNGGEAPYTWTVPQSSDIPGGLKLRKDGRIKGTPSQAGDHVFAVVAKDSAGREKQIVVELKVILEPVVVQCGDVLSGEFTGSGFGVDSVDFDDHENLEWMAVQLPDDLTTRIELDFTNAAVSTLYVERPSELIGSWDLEDHYVGHYLNPGFTPLNIPIDAGTNPSLSGYQGQELLPFLLVGQSAGAWSLEVVCTDGPIFIQTEQYPTRLGDPLEIDYDVYGDQTDVRIFTEDELPPWMEWDETTGSVTGIAQQEGGWEFTVIAETPDGRRREEPSIIGVYDVQDVTCGSVNPFQTVEGYYEGEFSSYWDPKGWQVFRLPLDEVEPSIVTLETSGAEGHYLGTASPEPDWLRFYGGAERRFVSGANGLIDITARTYPAVHHYLDDGELFFVAGSLGVDTTMAMTVDCDLTARPNEAGLPVIPPLASVDFQLDALGGTPPYEWYADRLPNGLTLTTDGRITGSTGEVGTTDVEVSVVDKLGTGGSEVYPMYVGYDQACAGYTPIACGESIDGRFSSAYYQDGNGPDSTETFCLVIDEQQAIGFDVYADKTELRVDIADPGASDDDMFDDERGTLVAFVERESSEGVAVNEFTWPILSDYRDLPMLVAVRAFEAGKWTVHLTCE